MVALFRLACRDLQEALAKLSEVSPSAVGLQIGCESHMIELTLPLLPARLDSCTRGPSLWDCFCWSDALLKEGKEKTDLSLSVSLSAV